MPGNYVRYVIGGAIGNHDTWSTSYATRGAAGNQSTLDALCALVAAGVNSAKPDIGQLMLAADSITSVTAYDYVDGSDTADLVSQVAISGWNGAKSGPVSPSQVALVASLRTASPGRSHRGRMFWPCRALTIGAASGIIDDTQGGQLANGVKTILNSTLSGPNIAHPCVYSKKLNNTFDITTVIVDWKPDTMRSRSKGINTGASRTIEPL